MNGFFYRVNKGDTAKFLSEKFSVPIVSIIKKNNLKKEIEAGDVLYIEKEDKKTYVCKVSDTISSVCKKFSIEKEDFILTNGVTYLFYALVVYV